MHIHKRILILCLVSFVWHPSTSMGQSLRCDAEKSERLATAFALALFYPDRFVSYAQQESATLSSGAFRRCIEAVKNAYSAGSINHPSGEEVYARSMDIASRAGVPHLGEKVANDTMRTQGNPAVVGVLLDELSRVLRGELAYDSTFMYQDAVQRQSLAQGWKMYGGEELLPGFWDNNTELMFEVARWYMEFVARAVQ